MSAPIVLLAFANDRTGQWASLREELARERREIRAIFEAAEQAGLCKVEPLVDATPRDVVGAFQNPAWRDRIAIFHFSGHADSERLLFESEDGGVAAAAGMDLAEFLGRQQALTLVFLNGCATQGHVAALLAAGTRAVIGTERKVDSVAACEFAIAFYRALAQGRRGLREAFDEAQAGARLIDGASTRGLGYPSANAAALPAPCHAWSLHVRPGAEAVNDWCLDLDPLLGLPLPTDIGLPAEPFLNLQSFGREQAGVFFGRGGFIRSLHDALADPSTDPILLLCGQSGVGKSSLLYAGLLPRLESRFAVVVLERPPTVGVTARLAERIGFGSRLAEAWRSCERIDPKPLLVVIDHAEDLLPDNGSAKEDWEALRQELAMLFLEPKRTPRGKLLLAFRKEWLADLTAGLDAWKLPHMCKVLDRLDLAGVIESIEGVCQDPRCQAKYQLTFASDRDGQPLANRIAADLLADRRAPVAPTLQILLRRLWDRAKSANDAEPVIDAGLYEDEKQRGLLLDDFLQERMAELKRLYPHMVESGLALDILHRHTNELDTSTECVLAQLDNEYAHCRGDLQTALGFFKNGFVLADATGPGREAPKSTRLSHDTLAPLIRREFQRSALPGQQARRILEERSKRSVAILPQEDLAAVERGRVGMRLWTETETRMVESARHRRKLGRWRQRWLRGVVATLALAVLSTSAAITWQWWEGLRYQSLVLAENARREAELGHTTVALLLALEALPSANRVRPWVDRAETALAFVLSHPIEQAVPPQPGQVLDAAFSPDGHRLATAGEQGAQLWGWADGRWDGKHENIHPLHEGKVYQTLFSADSHYLLTASEDCTARVWDAESSAELLRIRQGGAVLQAELSPRGDTLITRGEDGAVRLWSGIASAIAAAKTLGTPLELSDDGKVARMLAKGTRASHAAYSRDGARIAIATGEDVHILNADSGQEIRRLPHAGELTQTSFSPDGRWLAAASLDGVAWLWDTADGRKRLHLVHGDGVEAMAFSPDGHWLATAARDKRVRVWSIATGRELFDLNQGGPVWRVAFSADGKTLAIVTQTAGLRLLTLAHGIETFRVQHSAPVESAQFSPDGRFIATASVDGEALIIDASNGNLRHRLKHGSEVNHASFSADGTQLATAATDGSVRLWDATTGKERLRMAHADKVWRAVFDQAAGRLLSVSEDGTARVWDTANGAERLRLRHVDAVLDAAFSPDGHWIVTASADGTARLWDAQTGLGRFTWRHGAALRHAAFSPDGQRVVTASADHSARVFVLSDGGESLVLKHQDSVESAAFSPDGRWILTASADRSARIWNASTGEESLRLPHNQALAYAAFSPDGRHVVTIPRESMVEEERDIGPRVWDIAAGQERFSIPHDATVTQALFSPNGRGLLTVSQDKTIRFWAEGHLLLAGREMVEFARASRLPQNTLTSAERKRYFLGWE
jgi:WD40 repeat protein